MIPVEGCPLEEYEKLLHNQMGFDITGHKFEIYGYCQKCQRTRNNTTN
jgi:Fe2+ or Zn2+ uptake regulation protein